MDTFSRLNGKLLVANKCFVTKQKGEKMTIVMTNDCGCLIAEGHYDTDDANEAMIEFTLNNDISFAEGDTIQIRR